MKVSMNGFRRNISEDVQTLRDISAAILSGDWWDREDFANAVNAVISHSNVLNCIYRPGDPDFTDMSHLEVEHLELENQEAADD